MAGTDESDLFESFGDGGAATAAGLALPQHLAHLSDGSFLIGESQRIRQVSPDGTISTLFDCERAALTASATSPGATATRSRRWR